MTRHTGDDFTLIELHKMAAERGDGLIPEILHTLRSGGDVLAVGTDVMHGSDHQGEPAPRPVSNENNVIAFPAARRGVRR